MSSPKRTRRRSTTQWLKWGISIPTLTKNLEHFISEQESFCVSIMVLLFGIFCPLTEWQDEDDVHEWDVSRLVGGLRRASQGSSVRGNQVNTLINRRFITLNSSLLSINYVTIEKYWPSFSLSFLNLIHRLTLILLVWRHVWVAFFLFSGSFWMPPSTSKSIKRFRQNWKDSSLKSFESSIRKMLKYRSRKANR